MRFVAAPTHVGDDRWPVLSSVRVGTEDQPSHPVEFVVVADRGEGTPIEPYATVRVLVWPDRRTTTDVEYHRSFPDALRSLAGRAGLVPAATVEVVVVRDPDAANDYTVFVDGAHRPTGTDTIRVVIHDMDLGAVEITPAWVDDQLRRADETLSPAAARHARETVLSYADGRHAEVPEFGAGGEPQGTS